MALDLPEPRWQELDPAAFILDYDKSADVLYVRPPKPRPGTSIDIGEEVWLRLDLATGEVLGFEVEDFESVFLTKHPEIALAWKRTQSRKKPAIEGKLRFIDAVLKHLRSKTGTHLERPRLLPNL